MTTHGSTRIIYLTAGAAGMFCGSCMHDNALAKSLAAEGWDIQLLPTYTPIRTDESDFSVDQVFFGGINVFLQQKIPLVRHIPAFLDRFLDSPWLIRRVTSRAMETDLKTLGQLAHSMLKGMKGNQRKEVIRLCDWFRKTSKPDLLIFSNILIGGCIPEIKKRIDIPILATLQGDDVFLDSLPQPYRGHCISSIKEIVQHVDGFITHSQFFRSYMSEYFAIPIEKIFVTPLGLDVSDFKKGSGLVQTNDEPSTGTIGYLARLAPEKGLHFLVDGFIELKKNPDFRKVKLKIAGWLGPQDKSYADDQFEKLVAAGLQNDFEYVGSIERTEKIAFLNSLDILSVPTKFLEPKGLYVLEALAAGVPVVQPAHGAFPELIDEIGGGLLFEPNNLTDFIAKLSQLLKSPRLRIDLGRSGQKNVHDHRNATTMAKKTGELVSNYIR